MLVDPTVKALLPDSELVLKFESLGDNCELGIVQRMAGVEPLGMFRFAGAPLRHLIKALECRFEGMADPDQIRVQPENGEYMIKLTKYDFLYHAYVKIGEADPRALHKQQARTVAFLIRKLIDDLENPTKIMVFRQNEPLSANDLTDLRLAVAAYGPATILWVQQARPGYPPGSVAVVDDRLMVGYVRRLAVRENVPDLDLDSWLVMLRKAYSVRPGPPTARLGSPPPRIRTDLVFGEGGNATSCTGVGWSAPEDGFTWSIDDRSLITVESPGAAEDYWLELDVIPFVAPPSLTVQSLSLAVNGEPVHVFDPLERGTVGCVVPGRLLRGRDSIEIEMDHPEAASPRAVAGQNDDRRLAIAFRTLSLIGH
jgi:hypothetical protein